MSARRGCVRRSEHWLWGAAELVAWRASPGCRTQPYARVWRSCAAGRRCCQLDGSAGWVEGARRLRWLIRQCRPSYWRWWKRQPPGVRQTSCGGPPSPRPTWQWLWPSGDIGWHRTVLAACCATLDTVCRRIEKTKKADRLRSVRRRWSTSMTRRVRFLSEANLSFQWTPRRRSWWATSRMRGAPGSRRDSRSACRSMTFPR